MVQNDHQYNKLIGTRGFPFLTILIIPWLLVLVMGQDGPEGSTDDEKGFDLLPEEQGGKGIGILFYFKWQEDRERFPPEFMDYLMQLDEGSHIDYGMVVKGDISDMDELTLMKKVSNYTQAVNNTLFDLGVVPPFYYLAVPLLNRDYAQDISDMIKDSFKLQSTFFSYPQ
jgi:hypothetical protein